MSSPGPARTSTDLADVVEMLLDKGLVINADVAVSIGDTELLGIQIRAALASFETAAQYGLEFPEGTDQERVEEMANRTGGRLQSTRQSTAPHDSTTSTPGEATGIAMAPRPEDTDEDDESDVEESDEEEAGHGEPEATAPQSGDGTEGEDADG